MKRLVAVLLSTLLTTSSVWASPVNSSGQSSEYPDVEITLNETEQETGFLYSEKTYVPLNLFRKVEFNGVKPEVTWNNDTKTASITLDSTGYYFEININNATSEVITVINDEVEYQTLNMAEIGCEVINQDGYNYVPISLLRDYLYIDVLWDADTKSVDIPGTLCLPDSYVVGWLDEDDNPIEEPVDESDETEIDAVDAINSLSDDIVTTEEDAKTLVNNLKFAIKDEEFNNFKSDLADFLPEDMSDSVAGLVTKIAYIDASKDCLEEVQLQQKKYNAYTEVANMYVVTKLLADADPDYDDYSDIDTELNDEDWNDFNEMTYDLVARDDVAKLLDELKKEVELAKGSSVDPILHFYSSLCNLVLEA